MLKGLKWARARKELTLVELARKSGRNRDTINQLENLKHGADRKTVSALARALGVSERELIDGS